MAISVVCKVWSSYRSELWLKIVNIQDDKESKCWYDQQWYCSRTKLWIGFITELQRWQKETNIDLKKKHLQYNIRIIYSHNKGNCHNPGMQWPSASRSRPSEDHYKFTSVTSCHYLGKGHRVRTFVPSNYQMVRAIDCTLMSPPITGLKNYMYIHKK